MKQPVFSVLFALLLILSCAGQMADAAPAHDGLSVAAQDGNLIQLRALLAHHADPDQADASGATPLAWAIVRHRDDVAALLLKAGADPDRADVLGVSPLMLAAHEGESAAVARLLAAGADPNRADRNGETPLMTAVHGGLADMAALLLAHGADPNLAEHRFGQTALMWAAGHPDLTRLLLAHGADPRAVTRAWTVSTTIYTPVTVTLGVTGIPWNNDGDYQARAGGYDALLFAVQADDAQSVRLLLDKGADAGFAAADGTTPLLLALYHWRDVAGALKFAGNMEIANLLLDHGARADNADAAGYTPLHGAVLAMMPRLGLGAGGTREVGKAPDPVQEADGLALVRRLLAAGGDPNRATRYPTGGPIGNIRINPLPPGSTPLHAAAMVRSAALIEMLCAQGGDVNRLRRDGHSPFSVAALYDNLPGVQAMLARGAPLDRRYDPSDEIADPVLPKTERRHGQTILHIAGQGGAASVVSYLIAQGAPADLRNDHGETPLDLAEKQKLFRYRRDIEGRGGIPVAPPVRSTATTDAFRNAVSAKVADARSSR